MLRTSTRLVGERGAVHVEPMYVGNSNLFTPQIDDDSTLMIGLGSRVRVTPTVYLVGELTPRVSGYAPGATLGSFAIEKRAGGHMFQLNFSNYIGTTLRQITQGRSKAPRHTCTEPAGLKTCATRVQPPETGTAMKRSRKVIWGAAIAVAVGLAGCKGSSENEPSPAPGATITISGNVVTPKNVTVNPGSQVMFVNNDSRDHNMVSDPHPEHTDCPAINNVGVLRPGQSRQTGNLNSVRVCGFHDHDLDGVAGLRGTITIQ